MMLQGNRALAEILVKYGIGHKEEPFIQLNWAGLEEVLNGSFCYDFVDKISNHGGFCLMSAGR
jgi:hypothetical protein